MCHQKLLTKLEGFRSRNSQDHCYVNKDVYRLLYDRDFYYIAYNNIKSNDGALLFTVSQNLSSGKLKKLFFI